MPQKLIVGRETRLRGVLQDVTARLGEAKHVAMPTVVAQVLFGTVAWVLLVFGGLTLVGVDNDIAKFARVVRNSQFWKMTSLGGGVFEVSVISWNYC